jgi:hypothetical protein
MPDDQTAEIINLFGPGTPRDRVTEGLRLVKAFMQIQDPVLRDAIIDFAERIANPGANRRGKPRS